jgi:hypothetical protein
MIRPQVYLRPQSQVKMSWPKGLVSRRATMWAGVPSLHSAGHLPHMGNSRSVITGIAYLRGREAEGEQEQNFANQSALALYA